jgi:16S rRNA (adenine(1408)-N(1))-methyltransferase
MREFSARALHQRLDNLLYVRAAVEELPSELAGVADRLTVILPWGSLLAAVAQPSPEVLRGIRALCQPDAILTIVLGVDPVRDRTQLRRLGLDELPATPLASRLGEGYALAGFTLSAVRSVARGEAWPSTWARRLAPGRERTLFEVSARAAPTT